ncbi:DUF3566 domain-containing protein [Cellulomonas biazotea]|uniref:DUF3566 domain-containing protein n=1 Tax=Cellulomonas biazotea TaxID=1709 RepID=A0A402DME3_9CELL|nr:DUF3566 domain-containing protein [Cellulomonas biazotea]GCE75292.1 hypothetical protein CBZ_03480 [Cellulomonas biazotea]
MTDPTPPTIPPRLKPTTPTTARPGTSSSANGSSGARNGSGRSDSSSPYGPFPTSEPRSATSGGSSSGSKPAGGKSSGASSSGGKDASTRTDEPPTRVSTGVPPRSGDDEQEPASPLMVAVDTATVWFKKAAGATSAAFASVTRPRTEEPTMTSQATAPAAPAASTTSARPATGAHPLARPATGRIPAVGGPRRVRLAVSRVDPWSVMKLSFLLSVAIGIMIVVAAAVGWLTLDGLHVFTRVNELVTQITGSENTGILEYVEFRRIVSGATLIAVIDVFLLTALATIGAFLYNIVAALVGGVHVTMTDE